MSAREWIHREGNCWFKYMDGGAVGLQIDLAEDGLYVLTVYNYIYKPIQRASATYPTLEAAKFAAEMML